MTDFSTEMQTLSDILKSHYPWKLNLILKYATHQHRGTSKYRAENWINTLLPMLSVWPADQMVTGENINLVLDHSHS